MNTNTLQKEMKAALSLLRGAESEQERRIVFELIDELDPTPGGSRRNRQLAEAKRATALRLRWDAAVVGGMSFAD